jgi:aspartate/methionine/tyrosine aminotransferase
MTYLAQVTETNQRIESSLPHLDEVYFSFRHHAKNQARVIDFSSAIDMQVAELVWPKELEARFKQFSLKQTTKYPGLVTQSYSLEEEAVKFFSQQLDFDIQLDEVLITNGSLTSPALLMAGSPFAIVIHSDRCFRNQISAFQAAGKQTLSCPTNTNGQFDLAQLQRIAEQHKGKIAFLHVTPYEGTAPTRVYLDKLRSLAEKYDFYVIYDADVMLTTHKPKVNPLLPLLKSYRDRFIVLTTFSKEFNCPAIRIGLAVGSPQLLHQVKLFQQHKIEMTPTPSVEIARLLMQHVDVRKSAQVFSERMRKLVGYLRSLGWQLELPDMGINLFVKVPESFQTDSAVSPGTLFSYFLIKTCGVMVRPGILYGQPLAHTVRYVLSPQEYEIDEVFARFKAAGVRYSMPLPKALEKQFSDEMHVYFSTTPS